MTALGVAIAALFGIVIGSFLNVVIVRVPRGESLLPASHCPHCSHAIRAWQNVPILSWILLRGRCHACRAPISVRYPLVEAGTGVAFGAVAWWTGRLDAVDGTARWLLTAALCAFAAVSIALSLIDVATHRLPDAIVGPSYVLALALLATTSLDSGDWTALARGLGAMVLLALGYYVVHTVRPDGMGFGDVKLAGLIGLITGYLGWGALAVGAFAAFVLAAVYAVVLLLAGRAGRRSGIAFGPWMLAGGWVGVVMGTPLAAGYLRVTGM